MIIAFSGLAGSGKDTSADRLVSEHDFVKIALADPLKRICREVFAFTDEQLWGPSEFRNQPDVRYPRSDRYVYPAAPAGALWYPISGGHTLIDEKFLDYISKYKWCVNEKEAGKRTSYVRRTDDSLKLHQLLMGDTPEGKVIDHINGDGMDNRRLNLRFCTHGENHANEPKRAGGSSVFKGVGFDESRQKWSAKIMVNGETKNLGRFDKEIDAAMAYDKAAMQYFGDFALTNSKMFLTPRYALQQLGTNWGRDCYDNIWVDLALRTAKALLEDPEYTYLYTAKEGLHDRQRMEKGERPYSGVAISDVRFKNEIDAIHAAGGIIVRMMRGTGLSGAAGAHRSETEQQGLPDEHFDIIIDNREWTHEQLYSFIDQIAWKYARTHQKKRKTP